VGVLPGKVAVQQRDMTDATSAKQDGAPLALGERHADLYVLTLQAHSPKMSRCRHVAHEVALKFIGEVSAAALDETGKFAIRTALPGIAHSFE
jgi:hypothetical protein